MREVRRPARRSGSRRSTAVDSLRSQAGAVSSAAAWASRLALLTLALISSSWPRGPAPRAARPGPGSGRTRPRSWSSARARAASSASRSTFSTSLRTLSSASRRTSSVPSMTRRSISVSSRTAVSCASARRPPRRRRRAARRRRRAVGLAPGSARARCLAPGARPRLSRLLARLGDGLARPLRAASVALATIASRSACGALLQLLEGLLGAVARLLGRSRPRSASQLRLGAARASRSAAIRSRASAENAAQRLHRPLLQLRADLLGACLGGGDPLLADLRPTPAPARRRPASPRRLADRSQLPRWIAHLGNYYGRRRHSLAAGSRNLRWLAQAAAAPRAPAARASGPCRWRCAAARRGTRPRAASCSRPGSP